MSDVNHPERNAVSAPSLNGAWFRRERERIAVGRKPLALRLGIQEHKLAILELRKQDVPTEWLGVLAELGFRIPQGVTAELPQVSASVTETAVAESVASVPSVDHSSPTENAAGETVATSSLACMSFADAMRIRAQADAATTKAATLDPVADPPLAFTPTVRADSDSPPRTPSMPESPPADSNMATSAIARTTETEHQQDSQRGTQWTPFYGRWLRERREHKGIPTTHVARRLGVRRAEINTLERNNIRMPLAWIPVLLKLKVLTVAEAKAVVQLPRDQFSTRNGGWLQRQRSQRKLKPADIATKLGVSKKDVELIEARKWPLPADWFPALNELFAPPRAGKAKTPTAKNGSAQNKSALRQSAAPADTKAESPTTAKPAKPSAKGTKKAAPTPAKAIPKPAKSTPKEQAVTIKKAAEPDPDPSPTAHGLIETIVNYRLMLGERVGLPAVEVLAQVAADLKLAQGKEALSYDRLRAAMKLLTER